MSEYEEEDQVYSQTGQWVAAPPAAVAPEPNSDEAGRVHFTAYLRSYPMRQGQDYVWIRLHSAALVAFLQNVFPMMKSLYDRQPGVRSHSPLFPVIDTEQPCR
jgi:hypothetical protein